MVRMQPTYVASTYATPCHDVDCSRYNRVIASLGSQSALKIMTKRLKSGCAGFESGACRLSETLIAWVRPVILGISVIKAVAAPDTSRTTVRVLMREGIAIEVLTHPFDEIRYGGSL